MASVSLQPEESSKIQQNQEEKSDEIAEESQNKNTVEESSKDRESPIKLEGPVIHPVKSPVVRFSSNREDNSEEVEVIEYTDTEVVKMESSVDPSCCGPTKGPHIILFTVIFLPFAFFPSIAVSFYYGTWTWYNLYIHFSEERTVFHKIFFCPVLIITFPFTVGLTSLILAIYASFIQISWSFYRWKNEFLDFEKGFYGWLCYRFRVPACSPYEMIFLNEDSELEPMRT